MGRGWVGGSGKVAPGARSNGGRYGAGGGPQDARGAAVHNTVWAGGGGNGGNDLYAMNGGGNGHVGGGGDVAGIRASMPSPPGNRQGGGEGGPGSTVAFWETKKGMEAHHQQAAAAALNAGGFADEDIGGLGERGRGTEARRVWCACRIYTLGIYLCWCMLGVVTVMHRVNITMRTQ